VELRREFNEMPAGTSATSARLMGAVYSYRLELPPNQFGLGVLVLVELGEPGNGKPNLD